MTARSHTRSRKNAEKRMRVRKIRAEARNAARRRSNPKRQQEQVVDVLERLDRRADRAGERRWMV